MNRMFLAFLVVALTCSSATAQTGLKPTSLVAKPLDAPNRPKGQAAGTTKVAVFNVGVVFQKYERALAMKEETAAEIKRYQAEGKELVQNLKTWEAARQKGDLSEAKKELYEEKIINAKRRLEDLDRQVRTEVGKTQNAKLTILWQDLRAAVKAYSTEHDIQLVIAYGDPREAELVDVMPNINRKMQALDQGAGVPFHVGPGVDISDALVEMLNRQYREKKSEQSEDDPR